MSRANSQDKELEEETKTKSENFLVWYLKHTLAILNPCPSKNKKVEIDDRLLLAL